MADFGIVAACESSCIRAGALDTDGFTYSKGESGTSGLGSDRTSSSERDFSCAIGP
jgi:hypothetical protein